ncbi:hypothetical protein J25TS5_47410 [Paenibacillus faecis]|nr:hypothetical protein J25TS5_47410 [Paenibacillus faecis]
MAGMVGAWRVTEGSQRVTAGHGGGMAGDGGVTASYGGAWWVTGGYGGYGGTRRVAVGSRLTATDRAERLTEAIAAISSKSAY